VFRWLLLGLWYAAIVFTSSLASAPVTDQSLTDFLIAKGGHIFVYGILGWLASETLTSPAAGVGLRGRIGFAVTVLTGAVLASLDETRQAFVYGRSALVSDAILDTCAVSGGALLHHWLTLRTGAPPRADEQPEASQQRAAEDQHQDLHREHLAVAVDVRQERHHDRQVDQHEQVER
jgi:VanZ family protein